MKKIFFACSLMMALLMGTSTLISCDKDETKDTTNTDSGGGQDALKATKEVVTWNFQVTDMQLARDMGLKLAYYDGSGAIKTADVNALSEDGKFSVKVEADATKEFKMGFVAVWYLNKPAEEYTASSYNFESKITPVIVRTYASGKSENVATGAAPYIQAGVLKAQTPEFLKKRIDAGYNYAETYFTYTYNNGAASSVSRDELLKALGAEKKTN